MSADPMLNFAVSQYLYREAGLLDAREWEKWEELFTDEGMYWVPLQHGQTDPLNYASIFYEDAIMRDVRMRRLEELRAWSQQPITRTARIIGNVQVLEQSADNLRVRSTFQMTEWRKGREKRQLAGHYTHDLTGPTGDWKIKLKRIDLIDCDGIQDPYEVFL